ncbi:hypothetical protein QQ045_016469 [Rhodiola kirilowii]
MTRSKMMHGFTSIRSKSEDEVDLEAGDSSKLYPGISYAENQIRWGFVRKVYDILAAQIVLTTIVSSFTVLYAPLNDLLRGNSALLLILVFLPFLHVHEF